MTIDAHFHCWRLARGDYGWLTPELAPIHRDVEVADWQTKASALGVHGGVLVQAAPTEAETRFLLEQADAHAAVLGVVGWTDLLAPDAADRVRALALHPRLKGLRPMLQDIPNDRWILQPALAPALDAMSQQDLVLDALVKPVHLLHLPVLARRHPALKIVVDHAAKPDIARGQWQPWADGIARIAAETTAMCKLSGLLTEAGPRAAEDAVRPWAQHVLECFGPSRVVWGSDWPVLELAASYEQWWEQTQRLLGAFTPDETEAVLGGNAQRLYRLE